MSKVAAQTKLHERRESRVRYQLGKQANGRARLSVHRTGQHIYVQLIDDAKGQTLASASTVEKEVKSKVKSGATIEAAKTVGALIAQRAKEAKVSHVVFDRGGFLFHGRVKALADAARENGLQF